METFGKTFTPERLAAFKKEMEAAEVMGEDTFVWDGKTWLTDYAKYLVAFLTGTFLAGRTEYKSDE
jgi:hypothetical protein